MKLRKGFVSNSSSASFVASLAKLSEEDQRILERACDSCGWSFDIDEEAGLITGWTSMDNGELTEYLENEGLIKVRIIGD